jgi:ribonuclease HII
MRRIIGIDEVGRAAKRRASPVKYVIGIDEVGRGPLAGPVVVAAVAIPKGFGFRVKGLGELRDSKKMTVERREAWFEYFKKHPKIVYSVARIYSKKIDATNISRAANLAAFKACQRVLLVSKKVERSHQILLDGGLYLRDKKYSLGSGAETIIKGDEKYAPIMAASIVAKLARDRYMARLAKRYPAYGFEIHKGYGTKAHFKVLRKAGPTPVHRLTFLSGLGRSTKSTSLKDEPRPSNML